MACFNGTTKVFAADFASFEFAGVYYEGRRGLGFGFIFVNLEIAIRVSINFEFIVASVNNNLRRYHVSSEVNK